MDIDAVKAAYNDTGREKAKAQREEENGQLTAAKKQRANWLFGYIISFASLLAVPLYSAFNGGIDFKRFLVMLFGNCEVMFLSVTLCITSLNDYIQVNAEKRKENYVRTGFGLILFGAVLYVLMAISESNEKFNTPLALVLNIVFLTTITLLSLAEYYMQIAEAK